MIELPIIVIVLLLALMAFGGKTREVVDDHVDVAIEEGDTAGVVGWGCGGVLAIGAVGIIAGLIAAGLFLESLPH